MLVKTVSCTGGYGTFKSTHRGLFQRSLVADCELFRSVDPFQCLAISTAHFPDNNKFYVAGVTFSCLAYSVNISRVNSDYPRYKNEQCKICRLWTF
jgi:hypothetical protein